MVSEESGAISVDVGGAIERGLDMSLADGMATEGDISFMLYFSKDRQEGLSAFKEKRTPAELAARQARDTAKLGPLIRAAGIKVQ